MQSSLIASLLVSANLAFCVVSEVCAQYASGALDDGRFSWKASGPLIDVGPGKDAPDPHISIKDPTVVFQGGKWHLFATVRMKSGKVDIAYMNFPDWPQAAQAPRQVLALHDQYYCAPQVFYFTPHKKWYLVYQLAERTRKPPQRREIPRHAHPGGGRDARDGLGRATSWDGERFSIRSGSSGRCQRLEPGRARSRQLRKCSG